MKTRKLTKIAASVFAWFTIVPVYDIVCGIVVDMLLIVMLLLRLVNIVVNIVRWDGRHWHRVELLIQRYSYLWKPRCQAGTVDLSFESVRGRMFWESAPFNVLLSVTEYFLTLCSWLKWFMRLFLVHCPLSSPVTSTWPHLNSDVGLEEGEY